MISKHIFVPLLPWSLFLVKVLQCQKSSICMLDPYFINPLMAGDNKKVTHT